MIARHALISELVERDPSVTGLAALIVKGLAEEPVFRPGRWCAIYAERGVLEERAGDYRSTADVDEVSMPATVQATIAARIDATQLPNTLGAAVIARSLAGIFWNRGIRSTWRRW